MWVIRTESLSSYRRLVLAACFSAIEQDTEPLFTLNGTKWIYRWMQLHYQYPEYLKVKNVYILSFLLIILMWSIFYHNISTLFKLSIYSVYWYLSLLHCWLYLHLLEECIVKRIWAQRQKHSRCSVSSCPAVFIVYWLVIEKGLTGESEHRRTQTAINISKCPAITKSVCVHKPGEGFNCGGRETNWFTVFRSLRTIKVKLQILWWSTMTSTGFIMTGLHSAISSISDEESLKICLISHRLHFLKYTNLLFFITDFCYLYTLDPYSVKQ